MGAGEYSSDSSDEEDCSEMSELIVGDYNEDMLEFTGPEDGDLLPLSDAELADFGVARDELYTGSALVMLPVALASSEDLWPVTLAGWGFLIALAAGPQVFGQGLIAWALAHLPVAFASVSLLVQPVTAALVAWALFGEHIGLQQGIGAVIVLAGITLARRGSIRR